MKKKNWIICKGNYLVILIHDSTDEEQSKLITLVDQMFETQSRLKQAFSDEDKKLNEQYFTFPKDIFVFH